MNPYIEILLGVFLFAWLVKGLFNIVVGLLQIGFGLIGVLLVVIWTAFAAIVSLPMLFLPKWKRTCG